MKQFEAFDFLYLASNNGLPLNKIDLVEKNLEDCIIAVRDTAGLIGFMDISGKIIYPKISFKYVQFSTIPYYTDIVFDTLQDCVFLVRNNEDKWGYITATGKILYPEISFKYYSIPRVISNQLFYIQDSNATIGYYQNGIRLNGRNRLLNKANIDIFPPSAQINELQYINEHDLYKVSYSINNQRYDVFINKNGTIYGEALFPRKNN